MRLPSATLPPSRTCPASSSSSCHRASSAAASSATCVWRMVAPMPFIRMFAKRLCMGLLFRACFEPGARPRQTVRSAHTSRMLGWEFSSSFAPARMAPALRGLRRSRRSNRASATTRAITSPTRSSGRLPHILAALRSSPRRKSCSQVGAASRTPSAPGWSSPRSCSGRLFLNAALPLASTAHSARCLALVSRSTSAYILTLTVACWLNSRLGYGWMQHTPRHSLHQRLRRVASSRMRCIWAQYASSSLP